MSNNLHAFAISRRALRALTGGDSDIPSTWFNWHYRDPATGGELCRFTVIDGLDFRSSEPWINSATAAGVLPFLILTDADGLPGDEWPSSRDPLTPVAVHSVMEGQKAECIDLAGVLAVPDARVLLDWSALHLGLHAPSILGDVPARLWRAYGRSLQEWIGSSESADMLTDASLSDWRKLTWSTRELSPDDFIHWPTQAQSRREGELFIPLRGYEHSGVGLRNGIPATFGMLVPALDDNWPFGSGLLLKLLQLAEPDVRAWIAVAELTVEKWLGIADRGAVLPDAVRSLSVRRRSAVSFDLDLGIACREIFELPSQEAADWRGARLTLTARPTPFGATHRLHAAGLPPGRSISVTLSGEGLEYASVVLGDGQLGCELSLPASCRREDLTLRLALR